MQKKSTPLIKSLSDKSVLIVKTTRKLILLSQEMLKVYKFCFCKLMQWLAVKSEATCSRFSLSRVIRNIHTQTLLRLLTKAINFEIYSSSSSLLWYGSMNIHTQQAIISIINISSILLPPHLPSTKYFCLKINFMSCEHRKELKVIDTSKCFPQQHLYQAHLFVLCT